MWPFQKIWTLKAQKFVLKKKFMKTYHWVLHLIPSQIPVQTRVQTAHIFLSFFDHLANKLILVQIPSPVSIPPHIQSLSLNPEAVILIQTLNLILYRFLQGNLLRGIESCSRAWYNGQQLCLHQILTHREFQKFTI